jgi:hypothetical protein
MPNLVISVPAADESAYNPDRPVSGLLQSHIRQLEAAVFDAVDTEGEAATCIQDLTVLLQKLRPQTAPERHGRQKVAKPPAVVRKKTAKAKASRRKPVTQTKRGVGRKGGATARPTRGRR